MKSVNTIVALASVDTLTVFSAAAVLAQPQDSAGTQTRERVAKPAQDPSNTAAKKPATTSPSGERLEPDETTPQPADVPADTQANRQEQLSEEAAIVPFYNNFFTTYR